MDPASRTVRAAAAAAEGTAVLRGLYGGDMFDQLNEVTGRLEEIMRMLSEPETLKDPELLQKLMMTT